MQTRLYHIHLVSDASGELTDLMARSSIAQLENVSAERHLWNMVRYPRDVEEVLAGIDADPGFVLHTMLIPDLRAMLEDGCAQRNIPCMAALTPLVEGLSEFWEAPVHYRPTQYTRDKEYYRRMDAMRFSLQHDDGQLGRELHKADMILFGVSRTSKTPLCVYLANRGYKAANFPVVPNVPLPEDALSVDVPLRVGLTMDPSILAELRKQRLGKSGWWHSETAYVDSLQVSYEVREARQMYVKHGWPVVDVTMKSVEEIAAKIIQLYVRRTSRKASDRSR